MGTKQSSLAKSASTDKNEENRKLEVKLGGERGLIVNQENEESIVDLVDDDLFMTDSDSDEFSEDESEDEEGKL